MLTVPVDEAVRAIDAAAREAPHGAVAFDGDGTLWSGDVGEDFFHAALEHGLHPDVRAPLEREAAAAQLSIEGDARAIAARIYAAYLEDAFPEERVCAVMTWVVAGWSTRELESFAARVVVDRGVAGRLHREALHVIEHARRIGLDVFVVSASPRAIVEAATALVGIDRAHTIAVREAVARAHPAAVREAVARADPAAVRDAIGDADPAAVREAVARPDPAAVREAVDRARHLGDDIVLPDVVAPIPYGPGKVARLRERLGARPLHAAFGDNAFDVPLLRDARHAFAIRPKERLRAVAGSVPNLRALEPM